MPKLVCLYIHHVMIGFALSAVFVTALLYFNVANLRHLISASDLGWVAALMLFMFNGFVFAGVQFAIVIMRMAEEDPPAGGPKNRIRPSGPQVLVPIPVKVTSDKGPS